MPTCVKIILMDDGQMLAGEVPYNEQEAQSLNPVQSIDEAFKLAESALLGDAAPDDIEQQAFDAGMGATPQRGV